ncbi:hypothetical protein [Paenibacillus harenae]|uniref:hypothetical protein n=1 Tax=Paenibacillus harenae TaxID=306543 RepID=UPI00278F5F2A|nr:hypothetical protein [Paenibacillus harenae]MDQ0060931.1 hypothetical protein [Paenibacillus harenae]
MSVNRRLFTDSDFEEVIQKQLKIRVFQNNHIIEGSTVVVRFDDSTVVTQSSVSDITYHKRNACEFFELRRR